MSRLYFILSLSFRRFHYIVVEISTSKGKAIYALKATLKVRAKVVKQCKLSTL